MDLVKLSLSSNYRCRSNNRCCSRPQNQYHKYSRNRHHHPNHSSFLFLCFQFQLLSVAYTVDNSIHIKVLFRYFYLKYLSARIFKSPISCLIYWYVFPYFLWDTSLILNGDHQLFVRRGFEYSSFLSIIAFLLVMIPSVLTKIIIFKMIIFGFPWTPFELVYHVSVQYTWPRLCGN